MLLERVLASKYFGTLPLLSKVENATSSAQYEEVLVNAVDGEVNTVSLFNNKKDQIVNEDTNAMGSESKFGWCRSIFQLWGFSCKCRAR